MSKNIFLFTAGLCLLFANVKAQSGLVTAPYTNGEVKALANYGDTVFVGGQFSKVYSYEQSSRTMAYFDTLSGQHIPIKLMTNGTVEKIIRDENGTGFYIGGTFSTVRDSARSGVAHIDSSGNVTARLRGWKMSVPNVKDMVLRGDSLLVAGAFLSNIAPSAVATDSYFKGISTLTAGNDNATLPLVNGAINYMVVDGMGARYICGSFTQVGNQPRNKLAKIDSAGNVLPWEPHVLGQEVKTLMLRGNTILLGGVFEVVNGLFRRSFAEVDTSTGKNTTPLFVDALRGSFVCSIYSIDKWQNTLVLSGDFTQIGDSVRAGIAVIDTATGRATARVININGAAYKISVSGNLLYLGGSFGTVNGISRSDIASINLSTGVVSALSVSASALAGIDFAVNDLVLNGTTLYLGLLTFPINSVVPNVAGVVAINTSTNAIITQFSVPRDQQVMRLAIHQGMLYASGNFTQMAGNIRGGLASIALSNNTLSGSFATNTLVNELVLGGSNNRLLLSAMSTDDFVRFNNNTYSTGLLVYHTTSDSMFTFNHQIIGQVNSLLLNNDTLFLGGLFTIYGRNRGADSTRTSFAAIDLSNYNLLSPSLGSIMASATVNAIVKHNNTIILGGYFPVRPSGLVGFDLTTFSDVLFSRPQTGTVNRMCLFDNQLYLAGNFTLSGNNVGLISTSANSFGGNTTWNNDYNWCSAVFCYQNKLYAHGTYMVNGETFREMRTFNMPPHPAIAPTLIPARNQKVPTGDVLSFVGSGNRIVAAGSFEFLGSEMNARHFFAYQRSTGKVIMQNLALNTDALVSTFARYGQTLYIGGLFDSINGIPRRSLASVNLMTGTVNAWNPNSATTWIRVLHVVDSNLWVGGNFSTIAGQPRNGLAAFNLNSLTLQSGLAQLNTNAQVNFIKSNASSVFVGGAIDSVGGVYTNRLVSFNRTTLAVNANWKPYLHNPIGGGFNNIEVVNNNAYVMQHNGQLLKISTLTGLPDSLWTNPSFYSPFSAYSSIIPYRSGIALLGNTSLLIDTVQGNKSPLTLSNGQLSPASPWWVKVNTGLVVGDNLICGGWFANGIYKKHLSEYSLAGNELMRMETSQLHICKSRNFTVRLAGTDTLTPRTYLARLSGTYLGLISVPSNMSVTFKLPQTVTSGSNYQLTLESETTKLEASRFIVVGDPPVKTIQASGALQLCVGQSTTLFYTDSADRAVNTYKWYRNDTLIPTATQYLLPNITLPGSYKSIILTSASCLDTTAAVNIIQTGLCQAPTLGAKNLRFKNVKTSAVTVFWNNGNGGRRLVLAKLDSSVAAGPTYGVTYNPSAQFGSGDSLGYKNYVVYNGNQNECQVQGLIPGRKYHFALIEYNETGLASSYQSTPYLIGSITMPSAVYYNKTTGNLQVLSTWGTNTDGTGSAPVNFTIPAVYNVRNGTSPALTGNWSLDTNGSVVSVGTGFSATPVQLTIPSGVNVLCGNLNVNSNAVLTVTGGLTTNFLSASDTSLVVYNGTGAPQVLCPATVGRFTVQGTSKLMNGSFRVTDTLRLNTSIASTNALYEDTFTLGTKFFPRGHLIRTSGWIAVPFNRWIQNIAASGTNGLLPIGAGVRFMQLDITTPATDIGSILVTGHYIPLAAGNTGLPLTENGVNINTVGTNGYWKILNVENRQGLVFNQTVTLENFPGVSQPLQTRLINRTAGGNWQLYGSSPVVSGSISSFTLTKNNVSAFGEFAVGGNVSVNPLPVHWLAIDATLHNDAAVVNWQTASEGNNQQFEIERSLKNESFEKIGEVKGSGNTTEVRSYSFSDMNAMDFIEQTPVLYYRVKQLDVDGNYTYSKTVSVLLTEVQLFPTFMIYPNPSNNRINLSGLTESAIICDVMGNQLLHIKGDGEQDISALQQGIYFIRSGKQVQKFVKY